MKKAIMLLFVFIAGCSSLTSETTQSPIPSPTLEHALTPKTSPTSTPVLCPPNEALFHEIGGLLYELVNNDIATSTSKITLVESVANLKAIKEEVSELEQPGFSSEFREAVVEYFENQMDVYLEAMDEGLTETHQIRVLITKNYTYRFNAESQLIKCEDLILREKASALTLKQTPTHELPSVLKLTLSPKIDPKPGICFQDETQLIKLSELFDRLEIATGFAEARGAIADPAYLAILQGLKEEVSGLEVLDYRSEFQAALVEYKEFPVDYATEIDHSSEVLKALDEYLKLQIDLSAETIEERLTEVQIHERMLEIDDYRDEAKSLLINCWDLNLRQNSPVACPEDEDQFYELLSLLNEFEDAYKITKTAPSLSLAEPAAELQRIKEEVSGLELPDCSLELQEVMVAYMEIKIDIYLEELEEGFIEAQIQEGTLGTNFFRDAVWWRLLKCKELYLWKDFQTNPVSCSPDKALLSNLLFLFRWFENSNEIAKTTPSVSLAEPVIKLQSIKQEVSELDLPWWKDGGILNECGGLELQEALIAYMDFHIDIYLDAMKEGLTQAQIQERILISDYLRYLVNLRFMRCSAFESLADVYMHECPFN